MSNAPAKLHSMTGFARAEASGFGHRWAWEVRSVNGKGLDVRLRLPAGFDGLEPQARERITAQLGRGNVQATLNLQAEAGGSRIRVNEEVLSGVLAAMRRVAAEVDTAPPTLDGILAIRGVLDVAEDDAGPAARADLVAPILASLDTAIADLAGQRAREGEALGVVLGARIDEIERLAGLAEASPARTPEAIRNRLVEQVAALLGAAPSLDPDRLHQEAVLLATRADIAEELDRLRAHVAAGRALLAGGSPVGRQLDFLGQEFNRETNTLCSKSNDRTLTAIGLDLKLVVDQLREQAQNLE